MSSQDPHSQENYLKKELDSLIKRDSKIFDFIEEASLDGLWYWDLENPENEWMSRRFWETLGYDPDKMPHQASAWMDIINPKDLELANQNGKKHFEDPDHPYDQIVRYRHAHGHTVTIRCRGLAIRDEHGKPIRMLGAHNDLTSTYRVQRLLSETNRAAKVGSWEYLLASNELFWSDVTKEIHGLPHDFIPSIDIGVSYYKPGVSRDTISKVLERAISTGEGWDVELQIITAKNEERWVKAVGRAEQYDGKTVRLYGSFQDIHEQKLRDLRLAESEYLLRQNFETSPNAMVIANDQGKFTHFNTSFIDFLGYSPTELLELSFIDITHAEDIDQDLDLIQEVRDNKRDSFRREKRYVRKNGTVVWADLALAALRGPNAEILSFHAQILDLTAVKIDESRRQRIAFLEDKSKEMEQFAYIASHDLRQPILTIQGYVEALAEDFSSTLGQEGNHYIQVIEGAIQRMDEMIKGLLDYSRLSQAKQLQPVDLNELVNDVLIDITGLVNATNAAISVEKLAKIEGYPVELRQVFQNIITNALTYTREGIEPEVKIQCSKIQGGHQIDISDNGIGVPVNEQARIFGLFQRSSMTSHQKSGTGIGLSSCKTIIERHGGTIWVESDGQIGSSFKFTIKSLSDNHE